MDAENNVNGNKHSQAWHGESWKDTITIEGNEIAKCRRRGTKAAARRFR